MLRPTQLLDYARRTLHVQVRDESVEDADRVDRLAAQRRSRVTERVHCPRCDNPVEVSLGTAHGDTAHGGPCHECGARFFVHRKYAEAVVGVLTGEAAERVTPIAGDARIPPAGYFLQDIDQSIPLVDREHWGRIYSALSEASTHVPLGPSPSLPDLNVLTRHARDTFESEDGRRVNRAELEYVAKALLFAGRLHEDMSPDEICNVFTQRMLGRGDMEGMTPDMLAQLGPWLNPYGEEP